MINVTLFWGISRPSKYLRKLRIFPYVFLPALQVGVFRFYHKCIPSSSSSSSSFSSPSSSHGQCRTSTMSSGSQWTASSRSQWSLADLNRKRQMSVGSTANSRSQWTPPDPNRERQMSVGTAGLHGERQMSDRTPQRMLDRMLEHTSDRVPAIR